MDFDLNLDLDLGVNKALTQRYHKPKPQRPIRAKTIKYDNAETLARDIDIKPDSRFFCLLSGNFIFGDFFEALAVEHNIGYEDLTLSTLSLSQDNVDSLANLLHGGYLKNLNILVSSFFFSHERGKLIPYMYKELDVNNSFQLATARVHTKIALIKTNDGRFITIHGSANLRSSANIEVFTIEEGRELYDFNKSWHDELITEYNTINKKVLNTTELWQKMEGVQVITGRVE